MKNRYFLVSIFGGLIGACCVLVVVYVTNINALMVNVSGINDAVSSLHSRINDFYIFAGIVITLLLAINVGVFIKADNEIDRYIRENFDQTQRRIEKLYHRSRQIFQDLDTSKRLRNKTKTNRK